MMDESPAAGYGLEAEGDAAAGAREPEPEDTAPGEPAEAPSPSLGQSPRPAVTVVVPDGTEDMSMPGGLTPEPEAGVQEAVPPPSEDGGIDALTAAEIGLAAALGVLVGGSFVLAFVGRKR